MANLANFVKRLRNIMRNDAGINGDAQRIEQIAWLLFLKVYDEKEQDWEVLDSEYQSIIPEPCKWKNWAFDDHTGNAMTGDALLSFVNNTLFPVLKGQDIKDSNGNVLIAGVKVDDTTPIKSAIVQTAFADANQYMKDGVLLRQIINVIDEVDLSDYKESHEFGIIYESILKELQSAGSAGEFYTPRAITDLMAELICPKAGEKMADFACGTGGFITSWLRMLEKKEDSIDTGVYGSSIYGIEKKQFPYILCITNMLLHNIDTPQIFHDNALMRDVLDYTEDDQFDVILMNPPYGGSEKSDVKNHFPADLSSSETADLFMAVILYRLKEDGRAGVVIPDSFLSGVDNAKTNIKTKMFAEFNVHTIIRLPGSCFAPYTPIATNIIFFDKTGPTHETWFYRFDLINDQKFSMRKNPITLEKLSAIKEWWNDRKEISDPTEDDSEPKTWKAKKIGIETIKENEYDLSFCGYPVAEKVVLSPKDTIDAFLSEQKEISDLFDRKIKEIQTLLGE